MELLIMRKATMADLDDLVRLEAACFPPAEAASREQMRERLEHFPDHFRAAIRDGRMIAYVDGLVTNLPHLSDDMYADAGMHQEDGAWQMIFSLCTDPAEQHKGYGRAILEQMIDDARNQGRLGVVLTCKNRMIPFYRKFGFVDEGSSSSNHGGAVWNQMRLTFGNRS